MGKKKHNSFTDLSVNKSGKNKKVAFVAQISEPQDGEGELYFDIGMGEGVTCDRKGSKFNVSSSGLYRVELCGSATSDEGCRYIINFNCFDNSELTVTSVYITSGKASSFYAVTLMSLNKDKPLIVIGEGKATLLPTTRLLITKII